MTMLFNKRFLLRHYQNPQLQNL